MGQSSSSVIVYVAGNDPAKLKAANQQVLDAMKGVAGLSAVTSDLAASRQQLSVAQLDELQVLDHVALRPRRLHDDLVARRAPTVARAGVGRLCQWRERHLFRSKLRAAVQYPALGADRCHSP